MFIPTTKEELNKLGWKQLDIILVSGDAYIDNYYIGIALIGKVLIEAGYKVGIISQPSLDEDNDIKRLGEPKLFWGVTAGSVDSMVANYTSLNKKRKSDDFTPGGINNKRPDRATIVYVNLIKRFFKNTKPIVLGGIEASLRRIAHFDFSTNKIRKSLLFDSKADILVYGMGEKTVLELAKVLKDGNSYKDIRGICYIGKEIPDNYIVLPSFDEVKEDKLKFEKMYNVFYKNSDPINSSGLVQKNDMRYLIQNPPQYYLEEKELDKIHELNFERDAHPYYKNQGEVRGAGTIKSSIISHRGCFGQCNFCAIVVHQGRRVVSRSEESIVREVNDLLNKKWFKGNISDIGGPSSNMYGMSCSIMKTKGSCKNKRCLHPSICENLNISHNKQLKLFKRILKIKGIKKVFSNSGLRYDLVLRDKKNGIAYLENLIKNHISGQLKVAPEHISEEILDLMGKPKKETLDKFLNIFNKINSQYKKKQFLTYYFIAAHPGCTKNNMNNLKKYCIKNLRLKPEQVQIFTPTPSTYSTLFYYLEKNTFTNRNIFVEKNLNKKRVQKEILTNK